MTHLFVLVYMPPDHKRPCDIQVIVSSHDKGICEWERDQHMEANNTDLWDYKIEETEVH
jgi:hypothetical protein